MFYVEVLAPKQNSQALEDDLVKFGDKYRAVLDADAVVCITDNPMGTLSFQGVEIIEHLGLPTPHGRVSIHLNTFHTKEDLDSICRQCVQRGIDHMLLVSGDGSERLPRVRPADVGEDAVEVVTAVELLRYVRREFGGDLRLGVAFNPYEPIAHEREKLSRKIDAGAEFIITQPVIERHEAVDALSDTGLPVILEAWMSRKLSLLSACVGYEISEDAPYDPLANLRTLMLNYPRADFYLALCGPKTLAQAQALAAELRGGASKVTA